MEWITFAGNIVRERRIAARLSQRDLAKIAGVSQAEVGRIETHRSQPTIPVLGRILEALGVEISAGTIDQLRPTVAVEVARDIAQLLRRGDSSIETLAECYRSAATIVDASHRWPSLRFSRAVSLAPPSTGSRNFDALIAALVEDCCEKEGVDPPSWTKERSRFVEGEWFPSGIESLHDTARCEAPPTFRRHGVLIVADEFSRA